MPTMKQGTAHCFAFATFYASNNRHIGVVFVLKVYQFEGFHSVRMVLLAYFRLFMNASKVSASKYVLPSSSDDSNV